MSFVFINTDNEKLLRYASYSQIKKNKIKTRYIPHRYLGYMPRPNYKKGKNKHNALGFRGDEIELPKKDSSYRIFCLGGSTTYSTGVNDFKISYPYLLEENLKQKGYDVEVINAGVGSWTTWESLINLHFRIFNLKPDMIVIYHSINDMRARLVYPYDAYKSDNSGRRAPLTNIEKEGIEWIIEKSNILRTICVSQSMVKSNKSLRTIDPLSNSFVGDDFSEQLKNGNYPSGLFEKNSVNDIFSINKPKYFKENIESMIALSKFNNVNIMLSTFAFSPSEKFKDKKNIYRPEIEKALIEQNKLIKTIASEHNIACLDFYEKFPSKPSLFNDGVHVNKEGSVIKAQIFSDFISKYFLKTKEIH